MKLRNGRYRRFSGENPLTFWPDPQIHKILLEVPLADLPGQNAQANNGLLRGRHGRCGARVGEYLEAIPE